MGVDHAREVLVDERPLRVDVAEEDAVQRIVEHHVEPLERAHRGDLRHAEAAAIVGQQHIPVDTLTDLIERGSHDPEVGLRRVGPAEALGRLTVRNEVEQRLAGAPNDGDDIGTLHRGRLALHGILEDVSRRDDDIEHRLVWRTKPSHALAPLCGRATHARHRVGTNPLAERPGLCLVVNLPGTKVEFTACGRLGHLLRLEAQRGHRATEGQHHATVQTTGARHLIHHHVGQRNALILNAIYT